MIRTALTTLIIVQAAAAHAQSGTSIEIGDITVHNFPDGTTGTSNRIGDITFHNFSDGTSGTSNRIGDITFHDFNRPTRTPASIFVPIEVPQRAPLIFPPTQSAPAPRMRIRTEYERRRELLARRRERIQDDYYAARPQPAPVVLAVEHKPYTPPATPADAARAQQNGELFARGEFGKQVFETRPAATEAGFLEPEHYEYFAQQDRQRERLTLVTVAGGAVLCVGIGIGLFIARDWRKRSKATPHT